jgi:RAP1 GTPase activating protein 1
LLQESEKDIIWYRDNFFGKGMLINYLFIHSVHYNFLALDSPRGPLAVSLIKDGDVYKALVRSTQGSERLSVSATAIPVSFWRKLIGIGPSPSIILNAISRNIPVACLTMCKDMNLPNELLSMEERQVIRSYKFGVGYVAKGQTTETEMLSNKPGISIIFSMQESVSEEYKKFLNFLGETIELKAWKGYRAGLDVSGGTSTALTS